MSPLRALVPPLPTLELQADCRSTLPQRKCITSGRQKYDFLNDEAWGGARRDPNTMSSCHVLRAMNRYIYIYIYIYIHIYIYNVNFATSQKECVLQATARAIGLKHKFTSSAARCGPQGCNNAKNRNYTCSKPQGCETALPNQARLHTLMI